MSEEIPADKVEEAPVKSAEADGPLAGERLAAARREQQITVLEVAKELHLDEPKVRALEQNEFDILGAPVFAKGHLRKYASLVGVDMDDVLQDYYKLNRSSGMPPVVGKVRKSARDFSSGPWIGVIVVIIIAAASYWWFAVARAPVDLPDLQPANSDSQTSDLSTTGVTDDGLEEVSVELPAPIVEEPIVEEVVTDDFVEVPTIALVQDQSTPVGRGVESGVELVRVTMTFSGDCWTDISDANGRQLYFDLGRAGRTAEVSGEAPLSVLFGDAVNVSLRVNGADYPISPADLRGETARLTINSP
jgi:cytoskeleton protein RodZ